MTRINSIKKLYIDTFNDIPNIESDIENMNIKTMIEILENYYRLAGFDIDNIDDLLNCSDYCLNPLYILKENTDTLVNIHNTCKYETNNNIPF